MFKRIGLFIVLTSCISWIVYVTLDIVEKDQPINYFQYFNLDQEIVFALHYTDEVDWNAQKIYTTVDNQKVIEALQKQIKRGTSIFFSSTRPIIVLKKSNNWDNKEVLDLFMSGIYNISQTGISTFKYGDYTIEYYKNQLLIHNIKDMTEASEWAYNVDLKCSFSKVFKVKDTIYFEDNYCKEKSSLKFLRFTSNVGFPLISDQLKFANHIPLNFDSYTFYSKQYLEDKDSVFKSSIFNEIVESGVIHLKSKNRSVFLFDFIDTKIPIQTINERFQLQENNENTASFDELKLTMEESKKNQKAFIFQNNEIALFSNDKEYFDEVLTELSIGSILSSNRKEMQRIFGDLPKKVFYRSVGEKGGQAFSISGSTFLITNSNHQSLELDTSLNEDRDYFAMNPSYKILDFVSMNERGNVIFSTTNGVYGYQGGEEKWHKTYKNTPISLVSNVSSNQVVLEFFDSLVVLDQFGNQRFNFPITGQQGFKVFEQAGKLSLLLFDEKQIKLISEKSGIYKSVNIPEQIIQIEVIDQSDKAFILGTDHLFELDLNSYSLMKKQKMVKGYQLYVSPKGVVLAQKVGNTIKILDERSNEIGISYPNLLLHGAIEVEGQSAIMVSSLNRLYVINNKGQLVWGKTIPVNEISAIFSGFNKENTSIMAVVDGIENKMLLIDSKGEKYFTEDFHASKKVEITSFGSSGYSISTFLNNYLIQYNK